MKVRVAKEPDSPVVHILRNDAPVTYCGLDAGPWPVSRPFQMKLIEYGRLEASCIVCESELITQRVARGTLECSVCNSVPRLIGEKCKLCGRVAVAQDVTEN